jgi:hypothetical protein
MFIGLMTCLLSKLDGSSSVFCAPFPKNLTLIAAHPRIGRRRGIVITAFGLLG